MQKNRFWFLGIALIVLFSSSVTAVSLKFQPNYCIQDGDCTLNDLYLTGNLTMIGDVYNISILNQNVTGQIDVIGNIYASGNITGNNIIGDVFVGDGSQLTGISSLWSNVSGDIYQDTGFLLVNSTTSVLDINGAGVRLYYSPAEKAFVVGEVTSTQWDSLGDYSFAYGYNTEPVGDGSFAGGFAEGAGTSQIIADDEGGFAQGKTDADSGDTCKIWADSSGSFAQGYCYSNGGATGLIWADATGDFAQGQVSADSFPAMIRSNANGGMAQGIADRANISCLGGGCFAQGYTGFLQNIIASGKGSLAHGYSEDGHIIASGDNSLAIGDRVQATQEHTYAIGEGFNNTDDYSFMVGFNNDPTFIVKDGNVTSLGNMTADYFKGDGSLLTGISAGGGTSVWNSTNGDVFLNDSTGQILGEQGSTASPTYSFLNDMDSGFSHSGTDGRVDINLNGGLATRFATFGIWTVDGGISAPAFSFFNDADTGMYRDTTDTLAFGAGGKPYLEMDEVGQMTMMFNEYNYNMDYIFEGDNTAEMVFFDGGNERVGIATNTPSYPLEVNKNVSGISIYASGNISANDYITRTSVFDKSNNVWDYVLDSDDYKTLGKIEHSKFYGYQVYEIPDTSRPVKVLVYDKEKNETYWDDSYPYNKTVKGVSINKEIDLLRQAVYELKTELCLYRAYSWC